jgi:hypothetical protein
VTIALGVVAVIGGGCYGSFYVRQLLTARDKGAITFRALLAVDRDEWCPAAALLASPDCGLAVSDWDTFLDGYLGDDSRDDDMVVPTPLMPHLMAQWLHRRARREWPDRRVDLIPAQAPMGTPYDRLHADGTRYVSYADWLCPTHCVEPLLCPAIGAPRTWEMTETVNRWSEAHSRTNPTATAALFACKHIAYGVGMYSARAARDAFAALVPIGNTDVGGDQVIGSISGCHGAVAVLRVGGRQ